jgi:hypothetical protein
MAIPISRIQILKIPSNTREIRMKYISDHFLRQLEGEEELKAIEEYQRRLAEKGLVPETHELLLRRYRSHLASAGALLLGVVISAVTILVIFIVFNWLLHIGG